MVAGPWCVSQKASPQTGWMQSFGQEFSIKLKCWSFAWPALFKNAQAYGQYRRADFWHKHLSCLKFISENSELMARAFPGVFLFVDDDACSKEELHKIARKLKRGFHNLDAEVDNTGVPPKRAKFSTNLAKCSQTETNSQETLSMRNTEHCRKCEESEKCLIKTTHRKRSLSTRLSRVLRCKSKMRTTDNVSDNSESGGDMSECDKSNIVALDCEFVGVGPQRVNALGKFNPEESALPESSEPSSVSALLPLFSSFQFCQPFCWHRKMQYRWLQWKHHLWYLCQTRWHDNWLQNALEWLAQNGHATCCAIRGREKHRQANIEGTHFVKSVDCLSAMFDSLKIWCCSWCFSRLHSRVLCT